MNKLEQAAQQALEALELTSKFGNNENLASLIDSERDTAITALREALEQTVAQRCDECLTDNGHQFHCSKAARFIRDQEEQLLAYRTRADEANEIIISLCEMGVAEVEKESEQVEQEPVAWMAKNGEVCRHGWRKFHAREEDVDRFCTPLYAAPVRTKDLTDDEIEECVHIADSECTEDACMPWFIEFARAVIAAYKEKNK